MESKKLKLKVKKLHPEAQLPKYETAGAAAFDVRAIIDKSNSNWANSTVLPRRGQIFNTGLAFEVPDGHVMLAFSRSGMGFKDDLRLSNCVGVIDSDYRGELKAKLAYDGEKFYNVADQERILQCLVLPVEQVGFELVDELSPTVRGENGGGSTGKV